MNRCPIAAVTFYPKVTAMKFREALRQVETETAPFMLPLQAAVDLVEGLGNPRQMGFWNPNAVVADLDCWATIGRQEGSESDASIWTSEFERVRQQVQDHLLERTLIGTDSG